MRRPFALQWRSLQQTTLLQVALVMNPPDDDDDDSDRLNRLLCRSVLQRRGGVGRLWGEEESEIRRKQDTITLVVTLLC